MSEATYWKRERRAAERRVWRSIKRRAWKRPGGTSIGGSDAEPGWLGWTPDMSDMHTAEMMLAGLARRQTDLFGTGA